MAGKVESLTAPPVHMDLVVLYGAGLREPQVGVAPGLFVSMEPLPHASKVATTLGPTLEKFHYGFRIDHLFKTITDAFVANICMKLKWIDACPANPGTDALTHSFAQFLCSFGDRLEFAFIMSVNCSTESIQQILRSCPNLICDFEWHPEDDLPVESIRAIADRIKRLEVGWGDITKEKMLEVRRDCETVEKISFSTSTDSSLAAMGLLEAMRLEEKPLLATLVLNMRSCGAITETLCVFGKCAGALRVFKMHCQPQESGAFDAVAKASPLLEEVRIHLLLEVPYGTTHVEYGPLVEEDGIVHMIQSFSACPALRLFSVLDEESWRRRTYGRGDRIANVCAQWRMRRTCVPYICILGTEYLK